jgi:hypothetical protein
MILAAHATDEFPDLGIDRRTPGLPGSGFPSPVQLEASLVSADYGVWLYDEKGGTPVRPYAGQQRPEDPIALP